MNQLEQKVLVHSIESFGTHDGPGLRMVVFLQGCNLKCSYCQNPDTMLMKKGTETTLSELFRRAKNMKSYFGNDGGITISGGEPMLQSKQLLPLFAALKEEGIHTNVDTNGTIRTKEAQEIISDWADLIMFDIKSTSEEGFEKITELRGLKHALQNIALREASAKPYWLRYVLVPGYTDSDASLQWMVDTFKDKKHLQKIEVLPYHKLGEYKWEALGMEYRLKGVDENSPEQIERVRKKLSPHFETVKIK